MARSEQSDLGCEFLWHIYTNKSFTADRLIREVLAETQNQCQCPNPTSSMSNGTFEAWFLETLPPVGSSDASGRDYTGTSRVQPSSVQRFQSHSSLPPCVNNVMLTKTSLTSVSLCLYHSHSIFTSYVSGYMHVCRTVLVKACPSLLPCKDL